MNCSEVWRSYDEGQPPHMTTRYLHLVLLFFAHPSLLVGGDFPSPLGTVVHDVDITVVLSQSLINTTDTLFN